MPRSCRRLLFAALVFIGARPLPTHAQEPLEPRSRFVYRESRAQDEDWRQPRLFFAGGLGLPVSFPSGWKAGAGGTIGLTHGVAEYADLILDIEEYSHHFDDSDLRAKGATSIQAGTATFGDLGFGLRVHAPEFGRRVYGLFEFALPDVSRPQVIWKDASGDHVEPGTEIFGFDFAYVIGFGFEQVDADKIGFGVESRFVIAPGLTEPTEYMVSLRGGVSVPLPHPR